MRRIERGALFGAVALAALLAFGATTASAVVNPCASGKKKCVDKKMVALLKCHIKAEKTGLAVDPLCLQEAYDKFDGGTKGLAYSCFGKLEAKYPGGCLTTGDMAALEAKVDAFVLDVVQELNPGYPSPILNLCSSGKKKCVDKKMVALLKCHIKAEKTGLAVDPLCLQKAYDKFDGGTKGPAASCFSKLEAKYPGGCLTTGDMAALEAKVDAFVDDVVCELDPSEGTCPGATPVPTVTPTPVPTATGTPMPGDPCPSTYEFTANGTATDQDFGWTGIAHDNVLTSNVRFTASISGCDNPKWPCGVCSLSGPIPNAGPGFQYRRCQGDTSGNNGTWAPCVSNADCPGTGNACVSFAGPPQPQSVGGASVCSLFDFSGITGTVDVGTGDASMPLSLRWRLFPGEGGAQDQPCPRCTGGLCAGGPRNGQGCTIDGTSALFAYDLSLDCPPTMFGGGLSYAIADMTVAPTLTTGSQAFTLLPESPNCQAPGYTGFKCFCDTCNNAAATLCSSNADCTAVGATICGGRRCQGGTNNGGPCTSSSACPGGGLCGVPGARTATNACWYGTCTPSTPPDNDSTNEGVCAANPSEWFCGPRATFEGCLYDTDCAPFDRCVGGANDGVLGCTSSTACPGGTCEIQTCSTEKVRECFTDNGALGASVSVTGVASTTAPTLGALMCMPPASSGSVNNIYGLPGVGRFTIPGTAVIN